MSLDNLFRKPQRNEDEPRDPMEQDQINEIRARHALDNDETLGNDAKNRKSKGPESELNFDDDAE